jgi:hypothetical protein
MFCNTINPFQKSDISINDVDDEALCVILNDTNQGVIYPGTEVRIAELHFNVKAYANEKVSGHERLFSIKESLRLWTFAQNYTNKSSYEINDFISFM